MHKRSFSRLFHGDEILTFEHDGAPMVAMRRIVENMGMDWKSQFVKLSQQKGKFMCGVIPTHDAGGRLQEMLCITVDKLALWLATINPNKIPDMVTRAKVERYQAESAIALHDLPRAQFQSAALIWLRLCR